MDDAVGELLRSAGLRRTPAMCCVLATLRRANRPLSRHEIILRLAKLDCDPVTVYRCLKRLVAAGIVHRSYLEGRVPRFETAHRCRADRCHPHFTCRICGETRCMDKAVAPLAYRLEKGYIAERQKVLIEGVCASCARNRERARPKEDCS